MGKTTALLEAGAVSGGPQVGVEVDADELGLTRAARGAMTDGRVGTFSWTSIEAPS